MFWPYRSLRFLVDNALPVPDRIDFSSYVTPVRTNTATLANRVFSDFEAVMPGLLGGPRDYFVSETYGFTEPTARAKQQRGLATQRSRPHFRGFCLWTTPDGAGPGLNVAPHFDFSDWYALAPVPASLPNASFETAGACGTGDGVENPADVCTEWANGNVSGWSAGRVAGGVSGTSMLSVSSGACVTSPCTGAFPGVYVLSSPFTGVTAGTWPLVKVWARTTATDGAGVLLIDNGTGQPDEVRFVTGSTWQEYLLTGPVTTSALTVRVQVAAPVTSSVTDVDLLH
jgi:hypothetical protein